MLLKGSCHCQAVRFSVQTHHPFPFMYCYCSVCRKTAGGGGYVINIVGDNTTLEVEGEEHISVYRARIQNPEDLQSWQSEAERRFCHHCGSCLWVYDPHYPDLMHPFASVIDTDLPQPPEHNHIMIDFAASWVEVPDGPDEHHFQRFPDESLAS